MINNSDPSGFSGYFKTLRGLSFKKGVYLRINENTPLNPLDIHKIIINTPLNPLSRGERQTP